MKSVLVTSGEPAGIGPDICLSLVNSKLPVVVAADINVLRKRADILGKQIKFIEYIPGDKTVSKDTLKVIHISCAKDVTPGVLNPENASYVVDMLKLAADSTLQSEFAAVVTAPVQKSVINAAGINFTGHTEFFADYFKIEKVVMMLVSPQMRVALLTTHIPIHDVATNISQENILQTIKIINNSLKQDYAITSPQIYVAGLNPHAGENGYIGREELDIIIPALDILRLEGIALVGPLSADTMFTKKNIEVADVFLTMYHDQGLPVLKYSGFNDSINITLGLPIIRTSVDHGTALTLAGCGKVNTNSLHHAVKEAIFMANSSNKILKNSKN